MATRNVTPKIRRKLAAVPTVPAKENSKPEISCGSDEHPSNIVSDRLSQAYASLDMLYAIGVDGDGLDTLADNTLAATLWGAMRDIEAARIAAQKLWETHANREGSHG